MLPFDGHVHTQFSWDASSGDMHATCARAVAIGLPALAFTEHVDLTPWSLHGRDLPQHYRGHVGVDGRFLGAPLDVAAYLMEIDRCRHAFPDLRILSGIELSEGHWHPGPVAELLAAADLDRVVGSVHALVDALVDLHANPICSAHVEVMDGYGQREPVDVVLAYLDEVGAMAASDAPFEVLGHIDYPLRFWPSKAGAVPWTVLREAFDAALAALAGSGRALEVNTRLPLSPLVVDWWHKAGGQAVVFGSDAHDPNHVAHDFAETAAMVQAHGYRPGTTPYEHWGRA